MLIATENLKLCVLIGERATHSQGLQTRCHLKYRCVPIVDAAVVHIATHMLTVLLLKLIYSHK